MKNKIANLAGSSFMFALLMQTPAFAESLVTEGSRFYQEGNFGKAAQCFEKELQINQNNPEAHYYMGNIYCEFQRYAEAAKEYRLAVSMEPNGPITEYCKKALERIDGASGRGAYAPPNHLPLSSEHSAASTDHAKKATEHWTSATEHSTTATEHSTSSADHSTHHSTTSTDHATASHSTTISNAKSLADREAEEVQNSANKISTQTKEVESFVSNEFEGRMRDVTQDCVRRVTALQQEMQSKIDANGTYSTGWRYVGKGGRIYDPAWDNNLIRKTYDAQIQEIRDEASKKIAALKVSLKEKQVAAEDSAITIDREYVNRDRATTVKFVPSGTNIFVRNYETSDEPSGNAVPIALPPAKGLPTKTSLSKQHSK